MVLNHWNHRNWWELGFQYAWFIHSSFPQDAPQHTGVYNYPQLPLPTKEHGGAGITEVTPSTDVAALITRFKRSYPQGYGLRILVLAEYVRYW